MGKWYGDEYMNKVNWLEKQLKKGCKIEMFFRPRMRLSIIGSCGVVGLLRD